MNGQDADRVSSLVYLISGIGSPISGLLIDKTGLNVLWILISVVVTIIAHLLLGFTYLNPYIGVVMLGLAYSGLASGLWPLVALIIPEYQLGTAYGVCQAVQNLGLAIISLVAGWIVDNWGYRILSLFFVCSLLLSFVLTALLLLLNQHQRGILNMTPGGRRRYQEALLNDVLERQRSLNAEEHSSITNPPQEESADILHSSDSDDIRHRNRYLNSVGAETPQS